MKIPPLMTDEDKNFGGSLVLNFRKWWCHVKMIYTYRYYSILIDSNQLIKQINLFTDMVAILNSIAGLSVGFWVAGSVHRVSGYSKACTQFKKGMEGHRHSSMGSPWGFPPGNFCQKWYSEMQSGPIFSKHCVNLYTPLFSFSCTSITVTL